MEKGGFAGDCGDIATLVLYDRTILLEREKSGVMGGPVISSARTKTFKSHVTLAMTVMVIYLKSISLRVELGEGNFIVQIEIGVLLLDCFDCIDGFLSTVTCKESRFSNDCD